jgi:putative membrane protein
MDVNSKQRSTAMKTRWMNSTASVVTSLFLSLSVGSAFAQDQAKKDHPAQLFMKEAAQGGLAEVTLGQMAADKGQNEAVKDFGERMVKDHGQANTELKNLAKAEGVTLPTEMSSEAKERQQRLQKLSGAEFDKAYMQEMLKDHKKDIEAFEQQANTGMDPDVKNWAVKTLPTLREHFQLGQTTAEKVGVKTSDVGSATDRMSDKTTDDTEMHKTHERMGAASPTEDR